MEATQGQQLDDAQFTNILENYFVHGATYILWKAFVHSRISSACLVVHSPGKNPSPERAIITCLILGRRAEREQ